MSHGPHQGPGVIWHDDCAECERRAGNGLAGVLTLDQAAFSRAWSLMLTLRMPDTARTLGLESASEISDGEISDADARLVETLYLLGVLLERISVPFLAVAELAGDAAVRYSA